MIGEVKTAKYSIEKTPSGFYRSRFYRYSFLAGTNQCFLFGDCPDIDQSCNECVSGEKACGEDDGGETNIQIIYLNTASR